MQRVSVLEKTCGCPLFDKIWEWKVDQTQPSAAAFLVQFFYSFAKNVDESAKVKRVVFESPNLGNSPTQKKRSLAPTRFGGGLVHKPGHSPSPSRFNQRGGHSSRLSGMSGRNGTSTMEMYCAENEYIYAAIFLDQHDFKGNASEVVLEILKLFTNAYSATLITLKPKFIQISKSEEPLLVTTHMETFAMFVDTINEMGLQPKKKHKQRTGTNSSKRSTSSYREKQKNESKSSLGNSGNGSTKSLGSASTVGSNSSIEADSNNGQQGEARGSGGGGEQGGGGGGKTENTEEKSLPGGGTPGSSGTPGGGGKGVGIDGSIAEKGEDELGDLDLDDIEDDEKSSLEPQQPTPTPNHQGQPYLYRPSTISSLQQPNSRKSMSTSTTTTVNDFPTSSSTSTSIATHSFMSPISTNSNLSSSPSSSSSASSSVHNSTSTEHLIHDTPSSSISVNLKDQSQQRSATPTNNTSTHEPLLSHS